MPVGAEDPVINSSSDSMAKPDNCTAGAFAVPWLPEWND